MIDSCHECAELRLKPNSFCSRRLSGAGWWEDSLGRLWRNLSWWLQVQASSWRRSSGNSLSFSAPPRWRLGGGASPLHKHELCWDVWHTIKLNSLHDPTWKPQLDNFPLSCWGRVYPSEWRLECLSWRYETKQGASVISIIQYGLRAGRGWDPHSATGTAGFC